MNEPIDISSLLSVYFMPLFNQLVSPAIQKKENLLSEVLSFSFFGRVYIFFCTRDIPSTKENVIQQSVRVSLEKVNCRTLIMN